MGFIARDYTANAGRGKCWGESEKLMCLHEVAES